MHPLVLLSGMNCTDDLWTGTGLDDSLRPVLTEESMDAQVQALLEELPDQVVLIGLSLGAIVAMALACRAPGRVAGMCLVSTNAKAPTDAQRDGWTDWIRRLDAGEDAEDLQESILPALLSPDAVREQPDLVRRTLEMGRMTGGDRLRSQLRMQATRVDLREELSSLSMPTLVVSGRDDKICPPQFHTEIASAIPRSRLVSFEGGHLLPMERPDEFGGLVLSWREQQRV